MFNPAGNCRVEFFFNNPTYVPDQRLEIMKKTLAVLLGTVLTFTGVGFGTGKVFLATEAKADVVDHDGATSAEDHGGGHGGGHGETEAAKDVVIEVGRVMVPIYKARTITYVIAQVGVSMPDNDEASFLRSEAGATEIRNDIIGAMMQLEKSPILNGPSIDSEKLSEHVLSSLEDDYSGIKDVLFLSLTKTETSRG
ncbi:hypothetical protein [Salipiger sp. PrR003]|uniref:hypothetical protein n=1 Tax=Salipiger sp. PrR003 TaxID=2706776 RepID=UPI0013DC601A|nr:hypothetical protein [Salipiger sp. PrR003]NDV50766.1 hypothetical protein [Salipiger sp. PrR003]